MINERKQPNKLDLARSLALGISAAGALASLLLTLQTGRNGSVLLVILFSIWVLSPFIMLIIAGLLSRSWLPKTRIVLYNLMIVIPAISLLLYGRLGHFTNLKNALVFLLTPMVSWVVIAAYAWLGNHQSPN